MKGTAQVVNNVPITAAVPPIPATVPTFFAIEIIRSQRLQIIDEKLEAKQSCADQKNGERNIFLQLV